MWIWISVHLDDAWWLESTIDLCHLMSLGVTANSLTAGVSVAFSLVGKVLGAAESIVEC